jgi:allantoicase
VRLGFPGILRAAVVDTSFFTGNYPAQFSLEGCDLGSSASLKDEKKKLGAAATHWEEILPETALKGDSVNPVKLGHAGRFTHVRFKIYPDGGVARLRLYGEVVPNVVGIAKRELDLAAVENGGRVISTSDQFYSAPLNMLMPGRSKIMSDGWETRRRRGPGHDWAIVKLGMAGTIQRVEVDTAHFKGNFPDSCSIEICEAEGSSAEIAQLGDANWRQLLPRVPLQANRNHLFRRQLHDVGTATHVRLNIFPDGGISRFRVFGRAARTADRLKGIARLHRLSRKQARAALYDCCSSKKWVERVLARGPFADAAALLASADEAFASLARKDWLTIFRSHPAIGVAKAKAKQTATAREWSAGEQSLAREASPEIVVAMAAANEAYDATFGHIFVICATGKSSEQILESLQERLGHDAETEMRIAREEQRKITRLRLEKLLGS